MSNHLANNLTWVREEKKLSVSGLSKLSNVSESDLEAFESGHKTPDDKTLEKIALTLGVIPFTFYSKHRPKFREQPVDFRTRKNQKPRLSSAGQKVIRDSIRLATFVNLYATSNDHFQAPFALTIDADVEQAGRKVRNWLGIDQEYQLQEPDYKFLRYILNIIQAKGVFVFRRSAPISDFRGFTQKLTPFPLVVVNIKDANKKAQIFTSVHELIHLILGEYGLSDPKHDSKVEQFCNKVCAAALAPPNLFLDLARRNPHSKKDQARYLGYFSNKLNISLYAACIRAVELNVVGREYLDSYAASIQYGDKDSESAGGPPPGDESEYDYGTNHLYRYGSRCLTELARAIHLKKTTLLDAEAVMQQAEARILSLIERASFEQAEIGGSLETIEFRSFSEPARGYKFDVI